MAQFVRSLVVTFDTHIARYVACLIITFRHSYSALRYAFLIVTLDTFITRCYMFDCYVGNSYSTLRFVFGC